MSGWTVWNELDRMRADMDRLFGQTARARPWRVAFLPGSGARRYPLLNVGESGDGYRVVALAPGVDAGSFEVTVKENVLTVAGEKKAPQDLQAEQYHRSERSAGRFVRSLELPSPVDPEAVTATYKNGLLTIDLKKHAAARPRQIPVSAG